MSVGKLPTGGFDDANTLEALLRRMLDAGCWMLDEIVGENNFVNEIVWKRSDAKSDVGQGAKHFGCVHDSIF